jgi:hypothetical protein
MSQRVLHQYGAAAVVPAALPEIKAILTRWYRRFQDEGQFQLPVNEEVVRSFSASSVARGLGAVLEGAMGEAARHQVARLMPSR